MDILRPRTNNNMTHWLKTALLFLLPHHSLSRIVQWNTRCRHFPLRKSITRWFIRHYETVWAGEITPPRGKSIKVTNYATDDNLIQLERSEELGRFNMGGSTIIVLFGPDCIKWQSGLGPETRVQFGQALGRVEHLPT